MWVKIDDRFFHNPKIRRAGKDGRELYLAGLTYVNGELTDGFIHRDDVAYIAGWAEVNAIPETVAQLVALRLWESVENGFLIHDYHEYNPSRAEVLATRQARAEAGSIGGRNSGESKRQAKAEANPEATASPNANPVPGPVPVPEPVSIDDVALPATMPIAEQRKRLALQDVGLTEAQAGEFAEKCTLPRIEGVIAHARASPGLQNPTGYIISMLRSGRAIPKPPLAGGNNGRDRPNQRGPGEAREMPAAAEVARDANGEPVPLLSAAELANPGRVSGLPGSRVAVGPSPPAARAL